MRAVHKIDVGFLCCIFAGPYIGNVEMAGQGRELGEETHAFRDGQSHREKALIIALAYPIYSKKRGGGPKFRKARD